MEGTEEGEGRQMKRLQGGGGDLEDGSIAGSFV
jgi:hypothetical protein